MIANRGSNNVTVLLGGGTGTFFEAADSPLAVGQAPSAIVVIPHVDSRQTPGPESFAVVKRR